MPSMLNLSPLKNSTLILSSLFCLLACSEQPEEELVIESQTDRITSQIVRENNAGLSQSYAQFRHTQIRDINYSLSIDLEQDSDNFNGIIDIQFILNPDNQSDLTIDYDSGEVLSVNLNGNAVSYDYEQWFISIPADQLETGGNTLQIEYRRPFATDGAGLHKFTDPENGEVYLYTNFEPYDANRWFPHFDQPNLKAPLTLDVTAPSSWQVVANTRELSIEEVDERQHWTFPPTSPISSYVYALHAGPFAVWEDQAGGIPLRLFARNALSPYIVTEDWFIPTQQSFAFFQDYFDIPYPFGKYDQIIVPDFNAGAMENVAAVTFSERYVRRGEKSIAQKRNLANVIAHEMAHMWFGDLVTMNWWNGLWLNESFATYMANLEMERSSNFTNTWDVFYSGTKQWAYSTDQLVTTHPIELTVDTTADAFTNFDGITYGKGASVLKQLPFFLGEENFRRGVSNYLKEFSYQNTELDDFVDALAEASGVDLTQWSQEWLYQSGVNTIEAQFSCADDSITSLGLIQSVPQLTIADQVLRSQRTQVGLYQYRNREMTLIDTIPVTYSGVFTHITEGIGLPCPDLVFPNEGDMAFMKISLDEQSLGTLRTRINQFDSPTTRLMLWQSLWDSVQDTRIPVTEFIDFALLNIIEEPDDNVAALVADYLSSSWRILAAINPEEHADKLSRLENFFIEQLQRSNAGSEQQKIWFSNTLSNTSSTEGLTYLLDLLNGKENLEGLFIDQDKRWSIVVAMNRFQFGDYSTLLINEGQQDNSDTGAIMKLAAEAVRPDSAVKESWLNTLVTEPESYKLATMRTVMAYLYPSEQGQLLAQQQGLILRAIGTLIDEAEQGYLGEYMDNMSLVTCSEQGLRLLNESISEYAESTPVVEKSLLITRQQTQRCLEIAKLL